MRKSFLVLAVLALLAFSPVAYAQKNNSNGNSTSNKASNGNNNNNTNNPGAEGKTGNSIGNPGEKSPHNNGVKSQSPSAKSFSSSTSSFTLAGGETKHFGANNADEVFVTDEDFDEESNDSNGVVVLGIVDDISDEDDTFTLNNGKKFSLTDDQMDFLTTNGLLTTNAKVQINGNSSSNGNVVRIMKIQDPTTGQKLMVRLHTNDNVNQLSVKSTGGGSNDGVLSVIVSFFQSIFGITDEDDNDGTTPTPTPTISPSPTETISPTLSPTP